MHTRNGARERATTSLFEMASSSSSSSSFLSPSWEVGTTSPAEAVAAYSSIRPRGERPLLRPVPRAHGSIGLQQARGIALEQGVASSQVSRGRRRAQRRQPTRIGRDGIMRGFGEENRRCRAPAPAPSASECHWRVLTRRRASPPIYCGGSVQPLHPSVGDERTASAGICACQ